MDNLTAKVASVEADLLTYRQQLQFLETDAQSSISEKIRLLQAILTDSNSDIQHLFAEIQIDLDGTGFDDTDTTHLKHSVARLGTELPEIISTLEIAQSRAESAFNLAATYTYNVMDISHKIAGCRSKLEEVKAECKSLIDNSRAELRTWEEKLEETLAQIRDNENEIEAKSSDATAKRQRKCQLDLDLSEKRQQMNRVQEERRNRENEARVSAGVGIFGFVLAPFTGGASLVLSLAGGTGVAINLHSLSQLENDVSAISGTIHQLESDIAQVDRDISALEQQKRELQRLLERHRSEVAFQRQKQQEYTDQIQEAGRIEGEILELDTHASAAVSTAVELKRELQQIKQYLDECVALVKAHSLKVQTDANAIEQATGSIVLRKRNDPETWKGLLQRVSGTLDRLREEILVPLPANGQTKLLDPSLWNLSTEPSHGGTSPPIPHLS
ncbi:hypothetical protein TWF696_006490 [Orbilia brochopaga]|uniref:Uncharacterized protein n=1 Tax=Orbilia brochopaga TaxID=3140254 RepID=A0AAV9UWH2_9PEZI